MQILNAEFLTSSPRADMCPDTNLPEFAFIGRSNVGKSSLINMLVNKKGLAMTSSMPGKTLLINHYHITSAKGKGTKEWFLVDLPGYGYAQRGKKEMQKLQNLISHYVLDRQQLTCLFVLIDIRLKPQQKDLDFIDILGENGVPFALIFTKADKVSRQQAMNNTNLFLDTIADKWEELPPSCITSATSKVGKEDVLNFIGKYI
ncbi:MAG: YihA family ribosome biogenesis GTP-binding protein [Prevotellaceae bacterium]|nr:YihA family ribosome biogenesis GTP-binding protein [Candidatus Colivivens equi]MCQ2076567.1 ribosome biogenesis GTP-binding protein YihA/YsxC [Bacteroidaceae bacterium]